MANPTSEIEIETENQRPPPATATTIDSSSASTSSSSNYGYDVFISHRGPDTKKNLASHLYTRLHSHGIRTFLDQTELKEGLNFSDQIVSAIRSASVQVAMFSENFVESQWCLDELLLMQESGAPILPIFYGVKPAELRWTDQNKSGLYAKALQQLEGKTTFNPQTQQMEPRYGSATVRKWRTVLRTVSDLHGFDFEEGPFNHDEGQMLNKVVQRVGEILAERTRLYVAKHPTGLDDKVKHLETRVLRGNLEALADSFGNLTNLHFMKLTKCPRLLMLPESFGNLTNLQQMELSRYVGLERLPESFGNLTNLVHMVLSGCSKLERLPYSLGNLTNLQHMKLAWCKSLERLPESFGNLTNLQHMELNGCGSLKRLPESISNLTNLVHIDLSQCPSLKKIIPNLAQLKKLEVLNVKRCEFEELDGVEHCISLREFDVSNCPNLKWCEEVVNNWGQELVNKLRQQKMTV